MVYAVSPSPTYPPLWSQQIGNYQFEWLPPSQSPCYGFNGPAACNSDTCLHNPSLLQTPTKPLPLQTIYKSAPPINVNGEQSQQYAYYNEVYPVYGSNQETTEYYYPFNDCIYYDSNDSSDNNDPYLEVQRNEQQLQQQQYEYYNEHMYQNNYVIDVTPKLFHSKNRSAYTISKMSQFTRESRLSREKEAFTEQNQNFSYIESSKVSNGQYQKNARVQSTRNNSFASSFHPGEEFISINSSASSSSGYLPSPSSELKSPSFDQQMPNFFNLSLNVECNKRTATNNNENADQEYACIICPKRCKTKAELQMHIKSKIFQPYTCSICGIGYERKYNLERHQNTHRTLKSFECKGCNKTFSKVNQLTKHYDNCRFKLYI